MDPVERLAAYLADELAPEQRRSIELELRQDPVLGSQLAAMRRADAALERLSPPAPPAGFEDRLAVVVDDLLGPLRADDELGVARQRRVRIRRGWAAASAATAAGLVLVAGAVTMLSPGSGDAGMVPMSGANEAELLADEDRGDLPAAEAELSAPAADGAADGAEDAVELDPGPPGDTRTEPSAPVVVASQRTVEPGLLAAVADDPALTDLVERGYDRVEGQRVAADRAAAVEVDQGLAVLDDPQRTALTVCIDTVLAENQPAPVVGYLEVALGGADAVMVVGLVTFDVAAGSYDTIVVTPRRLPGCEPLPDASRG